jgi:hypothetical protein
MLINAGSAAVSYDAPVAGIGRPIAELAHQNEARRYPTAAPQSTRSSPAYRSSFPPTLNVLAPL